MKKVCIFFAFPLIFGRLQAQVTQIDFSTPLALNASDTYYPNKDKPAWNFGQQITCTASGQVDYVPSQWLANKRFSIGSYTFQPGYNYTIGLNASVSVGNSVLYNSTTQPVIAFGVSVGNPTYVADTIHYPQYDYSGSQVYPASRLFDSYLFLSSYAGTVPGNSCGYAQAVDFRTNFLTSVVGTGSFYYASSTTPTYTIPASTVTTPVFTVAASTTNLIIESFPGVGVTNNSTLNINSVIITQTETPSNPTINGNSAFFFSSSVTSGGGVIQCRAGATVRVTVNANGAPGGNYTTFCYLNGASFSNGSTTLSAGNGSNSATFVMPSSGQVNWTGNYSGSNTFGSGTISVSN